MENRWLRTRALLNRWLGTVIIVFLVLVLAGGWLTYGAHVNPGTTTEEQTVSSWKTTGEYTHSATVTESNPLYPVGETLQNRSVYFLKASPQLNGSFIFAYNASDNANLDVTVEEKLLIRSVEEGRNENTEVWRRNRTLDTHSETSLEPGSTVRVPFTLNANRTKNQTEQITEQLGDPPGEPRLAVITTVAFTGTVNGQAVDRTETYVLPIKLERSTYRVNATAATQRHETTGRVEVPREPETFQFIGGPVLFGMGFLGLAALAVARVRNDISLTPTEREHLAFEDEREEFDEWINEIELPPEAMEWPRAKAQSLGDLVDFAIDTNNSVIENRAERTYFVLHDGCCYTYKPPSVNGETASDAVKGEHETSLEDDITVGDTPTDETDG